jgi:ceramide glucosyltransferase
LRGVRHEIILSVADPADPALGVIERVRSCFPNAPFRLVIGGDPALELGNRKVARLVAAAAKARGDILMVSDSNVRVRPFDVAETIAAFDDERVGCVSNLFTGTGAADFGARIESLHLLSFVAPGSVLAAFAGVPCVVGKSMAVTCEALMSIGGFRRFANVLAEDQAMGLAVQAAGFRVALSPAVVRNVVVRRTLRRAVDRQIRWNKIRYAFSKVTYTAELLTLPLPFTILAALTGGLAGLTWPCVLPAVAAVIRIAQLALLARVTRAPLTLRDLALVPLFDLLQFGAQFVPYVDNSVTWRGFRVRIGADTVLLHEDRTPLAA